METTETTQQENMCRICNAHPIDTSENPYSQICTSCREKQIRYPIPKVLLVFLVVVLILTALAFARFPDTLTDYHVYKTAMNRMDQGESYDALVDMDALLKKHPTSIPVALRTLHVAMEGGYFDYSAYIINTYLVGESLDDDEYTFVNNSIERLNRYYNSVDAITALSETLSEDMSEEEVYTTLYQGYEALLTDADQDQALLYYYQAMATPDVSEMKRCLQQSIAIDPVYADAKTQLAVLLRRENDMAKAEALYQEVLSKDKYDAGALRGLAVLRLLSGNNEEAVTLAQTAYDTYPEEPYALETLIIVLRESGKETEADQLETKAMREGAVFDESYYQLKSGAVSLTAYYVD